MHASFKMFASLPLQSLFYAILFVSAGFFVLTEGLRIRQLLRKPGAESSARYHLLWSFLPAAVLICLAFVKWKQADQKIAFHPATEYSGLNRDHR